MTEYLVPYESAKSEFEEKRSRFISHVFLVESEAEARARIDEMKKKYYDARHNCWCFVLHDGTVRYGDDGEPQGTAGQPMLNVFQRENVENVVCIVTRYFGGILLGAGGLTRAYAKAAKDALDNAGKARMQPFSVLLLECPYPMFERIKLLIEGHEGRIESSDYGAAVTLTFLLPVQKTADFSTALTELSGGQMRSSSASCPAQGSDGMSLRRKIYEVIEVADKDDRDSLIYDRFMLVCIAAVCVLAGGYIALSALIMFQVEPDSFDTFFDAIYWAVVTLTTVGYGDIYPTSEIGRIVSMMSSFMGIAIVALPTGIITAGYMRELSREKWD